MAQINEQPPELPVTVSEPVRNLVYASIAKKPADRPQTAAHLARAAQALRRGDVAGAVAAVPGIAGGEATFTSILGTGGGATSAVTRVLPAGEGRGSGEQPTTERRRSPWTWPLVAVVSVLAVALVAIIIILLVNPTGGGGETPSTSAPPSNSPTPSGTPSSDRVNIDADDYVGRPFDEVEQELIDKELVVNRVDGPAAPHPDQVGAVSSLNPTGNVTKGSTITVQVYGAYPNPPAPQTAEAPAGPHLSGMDVTITFPEYSGCPSGRALTGYDFAVNNGTFPGGNPVSAGATSLTINLGDPGETTVTYLARCEGGITSNTSGTLTIQVN
jgi:hypothetical protein